jgi:hypothetical protein
MPLLYSVNPGDISGDITLVPWFMPASFPGTESMMKCPVRDFKYSKDV